MRTLFEIVDGAKDGNKPTHDECYYAMLALSGLLNFASADVQQLAHEERTPANRVAIANEEHRRYQFALNQSPLVWLGGDIPENPDYQQWRRAGRELLESAEGSHPDEARLHQADQIIERLVRQHNPDLPT